MVKEASKKQELATLKETKVRPKKIKQTDVRTVARQKRQKEIQNFWDDLISKIVSTFVQSKEQAMKTRYLMKELNKPSKIFKRINDINIDKYLNESRSVNFQTYKETILGGSLAIGEKVEDYVKDEMENSNVENVCRKSGQSFSKLNISDNKTEIGFIDTDGKVFGEEIEKEMKLLQDLEQLVKNLIKNVHKSSKNKSFQPNVSNYSLQQSNVLNDSLQQTNVSNDSLQQPNVSNDSLQQPNVSNDCLQQPNVSNSSLQQPNVSTDCLQKPDAPMDCLKQLNVSTDCLQQAIVSTDCLKQTIVTTDSFQPKNISIDCLIQPDLDGAKGLSNCMQQEITSTDCLKQNCMCIECFERNMPVGSVQNSSTSKGSSNTSAGPCHQPSTQAYSFQKANPASNSLQQANTLVPSLVESMDDYLKQTVETAYQILENQYNISLKSRRAASLIKSIFEGSLQLHERGSYVLQEIQNMIDILNCVADLNEYLKMDIKKMFLEQRELSRISSYVHEHLTALKGHCRSQKRMVKGGIDAIKTGTDIVHDIGSVKSQMRKLFKELFRLRRIFLIHSLKFSSIPYEMFIDDSRYTWFIALVKSSVIRMCGNIFAIEDLEDIHERVLAGYTNILRRTEVFTELVASAVHRYESGR